jgi:hypothetical protein
MSPQQMQISSSPCLFIAKLLEPHFCDRFLMVLYSMISRTIKNATSEVVGFGSGSEDHFKVAAVPAIPSGFLAHLAE